MSSSPSSPSLTRAIEQKSPVHLSLDFNEVLSMLKANTGQPQKDHTPELLELLQIVVVQYFDLPVSTTAREMCSRYELIMQQMADLIKDRSSMEMQLNLLLTNLCREYLPNFRAYRTEDCAAIERIKMDRTLLTITMPYVQFKRFTVPAKKRDNPFTS